MRAFPGRLPPLFGLAVVTAVVACSSTPPPAQNLEDRPRRMAPLAACLTRLPPRKGSAGAMRAIPEEQYWKFVFPMFDEGKNELPRGALACTGDKILDDPLLKDGEPLRGAWPEKVEGGDVGFGGGGDRLRLVWLKSHKFADGTVGGAIAMTRAVDDFAEVYAIGVYRGRPDKTRLGIERIGAELVPYALNEGCTGRAPNTPCETVQTMFVGRRGTLHRVAEVALERVEYRDNTEPGTLGRMEYHLTTTPKYLPTGLRVLEQIKVLDEKGRPMRKAELERLFTINGSKPMQESDLPLWPRVIPGGAASVKTASSAQ
jgi:hypothetical protein